MNDTKERRKWHRLLNDLAQRECVCEFWEAYEEYLQWENTISSFRKMLAAMAIKTVQQIREHEKHELVHDKR